MAGSRRHAGTVLSGRRRGWRPRSAKGQGDGQQCDRRPQSLEDEGNDKNGDDESGGVAGHSRPRTDKCTKCQKGLRQTVAKSTAHACEGRKQVVTYGTREEKQSSFMPSLLWAPSAHSSPLGLTPNDRAGGAQT